MLDVIKPVFSKTTKINLIPLETKEMGKIATSLQGDISDCYLISSLKGLFSWTKGKEILRKQITRNSSDDYFIKFNSVRRKKQYYQVTNEVINKDDYQIYAKGSDTIKAVEIASQQMYADLNPINYFKAYPEDIIKFHRASKFLKLFTGIKPIKIGDNNVFTTFSSLINKFQKKDCIKLLEKASDTKPENYCLIAGSLLNLADIFKIEKKNPHIAHFGCPVEVDDKIKIRLQHYYVIHKVDKTAKSITLEDTRISNKFITIKYNEFFKAFRSIVGYFDDALTLQKNK